ncbi:ABC transporter permease [Wukongibacter baidiensis]|uniref:ABC transporter permease n=1 Tax=Wukongibacter baidiensis TaxID=1723361 RepID=UPI003D7FC606
MGKFILKRVAYGIFTIFIIITITFFLIHAVPGDPLTSGGKFLPDEAKAAFRAKYGLDKPLIVQYGIYMKKLILEGNLGDSLIYIGRSVNQVIKDHAPVTMTFGGIAVFFEVVIGIILGILAAFYRGRWIDKSTMILIILGICIPQFVFASLLQYILGVKLGALPIFGWGSAKHIVMPALALGIGGVAYYCKYMRNSTLSVVGEDYIMTARAKGVDGPALVFKHVIRNSIIPIITMIGPHLAFIFIGAFVIEKIFSIPGLGGYYIVAVNDSDYSMILGLTIFVAVLYIISLIIIDILYGIIDPRIRITKGKR